MASLPDFRIPLTSVAGMDDPELLWAVINQAWPDVAEPDVMKRLQYCTPGQRALLSITLFIREVDNGGLEQFFWNSSGEIADEVISGFERLDALDKAAVIRQALIFFSSARSTPDQTVRREFLSARSRSEVKAFFEPLNEKLYGESKLWPLFKRYIDQHPQEFFND
jgi:hypothetical protein